jgi:hypothetical protein
MGDVRQGRWTTKIEGDFVVFLIGARLQATHPLRSMRDLGGFTRSMPQMLKYLMEHPEKGLLGYQTSGISLMNVQYWRSFEHLERFAADDGDPHLATWRATGSGWGSPTARASGTRPTWSAPGSTRRSTATCPRTASARPETWCRCARTPPPASG